MGGRRSLVQVFPDPIREWWDKWEVRGLVFTSLASQIILTLLGNRRKFGTNKVIDSILWGAYLLADMVPSIALGAISSKLGDYYDKHGEQMEDPQLMAFWAPFFLMHIGGPDTITAYSLEDNELWLRHLVGLVFQSLFTLYIILMSWESSSWLSYLSIPILIIGCIKYGERTWSLYLAGSKYKGDYRLASFVSKSEELSDVIFNDIPLSSLWKILMVTFFSDMVLSGKYIEPDSERFLFGNYEESFASLDLLHGYTYESFYTKISVMHWGLIYRKATLLAVFVILLTLHIIFITGNKNYSRVDSMITLILFVGAIISDFLSTILVIVNFELGPVEISYQSKIIKWIIDQEKEKAKRWNSIAQCNFLTLLCSEKKKFYIYGDSLPIRNLGKIHAIYHCPVSSDLKKMLFDNIKKKLHESTLTQSGPRYRELIKAQRLRRRRSIIENLEFHRSILFWHIVTDVCYYHNDNNDAHENEIHSRESKKVSDYMFYLLVKQRHMLPIGAGLPSLRDTLVEAITFTKMKNLTLPSNPGEACKALLQHIKEDTEYVASHPRSQSVFRYAFIVADDLLTQGNMKQMWDFLMELWIEILIYSATQCRVDRHAQQMANGGEFMTHIWMFQFLASLLEQFQTTQPNSEDENV